MILDKRPPGDMTDSEIAAKLWERKQAWEQRQVELEAAALRGEKAKWLLDRLRENPKMTVEDMESLAATYTRALQVSGIEEKT